MNQGSWGSHTMFQNKECPKYYKWNYIPNFDLLEINDSPESSLKSEIFPRQQTRRVPIFPFRTRLQAFQALPGCSWHVFASKCLPVLSQNKCSCFSLGGRAGTAGNQRVWHAVDVLQGPAGGAQEIDSRSTCRLRHLSQAKLIGLRQVPQPHQVTESEGLRRNRSTLTLFRIQSGLSHFIAPHQKASWYKSQAEQTTQSLTENGRALGKI